MIQKKPPGYISTFFSAWIGGAILCVAAMSWPTAVGILSALLILGGLVNALKKGVEMKARFQGFMFAGMAGVALLFAVASAKTKEAKVAESNPTPAAQATVQNSQTAAVAETASEKSKQLKPVKIEDLEMEYEFLKEMEVDLSSQHKRCLEHAVANKNTITEENLKTWKKFSRDWNKSRDDAFETAKIKQQRFSVPNVYFCAGSTYSVVSDKTRCDLAHLSKSLFGLWKAMDNQFEGRVPASEQENETVQSKVAFYRAEIEKSLLLLKAGKTGIEHLGQGK